jgi:predicted AlkP superfamily pyrophosphatase or phosphodiesterase
MTPLMLPVAPKDVGRLSDVLASALSSVGGGGENRLRLPKVSHAVVILVDGLGYENLVQAPAYARFLTSNLKDSIRCEFPSTTATSLTGFATGSRSSEHGVIGYSVFDRELRAVKNLLTGWDSWASAEEFKSTSTLSELAHDVSFRAVGPKAYANSGFTALTMNSAEYLGAEGIADRFQTVEKAMSASGRSVNYVYVPELDQAAHKFGVDSNQWLHLLEELDLVINRFISRLSGNVGVIVTSDHGVIDVPDSSHVFLDDFDWYTSAVIQTTGDPRCNFIYLNDDVDMEAFKAIISKELGLAAYICDARDLSASGWIGDFGNKSKKYLPDLFLIWKERQVGYDRRFAKAHHMKLIGQHGGISDAETRIPLIKLGKY